MGSLVESLTRGLLVGKLLVGGLGVLSAGPGQELLVRPSLDEVLKATCTYYTILYYTILYYTILYYTILYYTILYYTILYYYYYTTTTTTTTTILIRIIIPYTYCTY